MIQIHNWCLSYFIHCSVFNHWLQGKVVILNLWFSIFFCCKCMDRIPSRGSYWWLVNISSGDGLVPSGIKPDHMKCIYLKCSLPEPALTLSMHYMASPGHEMLKQCGDIPHCCVMHVSAHECITGFIIVQYCIVQQYQSQSMFQTRVALVFWIWRRDL